jgi:peroxiredoxin
MTMKALEIKGRIDEAGNLHLEHPLELRNKEVKVIILIAEEEDFDDDAWLKTASGNEVFHFLQDEEEIYSLSDGVPFTNEA